MKRYTIPAIFFIIGVILQYTFYFSWVSFTLLAVSCLLLALFLYSLDFQKPDQSQTSKDPQHTEGLTGQEPQADIIFDTATSLPIDASNAEPKTNEILWKKDPILLAREEIEAEERSLFCEAVKEFPFAFTSEKLSSIQYFYFNGKEFKECFWQKAEILVETDDNAVEWNEYEEGRIRELLPAISNGKRKLYIPLTMNAHLFGFLCFSTKETWNESEIQFFWEKSTVISEKIMAKKEYAKVIKHPVSKLFNASHFYGMAKSVFESKENVTLILFKFINTNFQSEIAIGLNLLGKQNSSIGLGLYQLEETLYAAIIPNDKLDVFSDFFNQFIEELDKLGYPSEVALGYSNSSIPGIKFDIWIKAAYKSLEESILYHAA
ncbi:hypothetical protein ND861_00060 [Leptospira sp. 2 VSF19]|uniref:Uncharacterized protein n=1 Tax=Leptospira soteropolitanensis TaxID=2950025 RepID=A0AAW5V6N3_9LEPT|nr:hypothetical protein [Leptospira soteropolitanensis]MCW7491033.1 hypothetical protein [Leptospira soteropolitanensis]MCW7498617.1 hypothetical protein [Leptospira soteropolitanensis]MCW7521790.1 hypothetical protein [Leptospira soteropolitanensis]MCW7524721.1 hypothetical protein [Leptospira soteropolitanensis]MCW7528588.1 hypothetical protein [Leptospira soteropolitanensis]